MKVLSLFDGVSCAREALKRAGIPVEAYYASEIDKYAIQVSENNYPDIVRLGSVTEINDVTDKPITAIRQGSVTLRDKIDLLIGGSPCQDLSIAKKNRKGLDGDRSGRPSRKEAHSVRWGNRLWYNYSRFNNREVIHLLHPKKV